MSNFSIIQLLDIIPGPQSRRCALSDACGGCTKPCPTQTTFRCGRCRLINYCSKKHRSAHRYKHRKACDSIVLWREQLLSDELTLRNFFRHQDPFVTLKGRFWEETRTRNYLFSRMDLIKTMRPLRTLSSVREQLEHTQALLHLSRNDEIMAKNIEPQLLLRLGRDQECYDSLKEWRTIGKAFNFNWAAVAHDAPNFPEPIPKGQNAFESVDYLRTDGTPDSFDETVLAHNVAATLLKIKLILDLIALQKVAMLEETTLGRLLPREMLDQIRSYIPRSSIIADNREILERPDHSAMIHELDRQIDMLYTTVEHDFNGYWLMLEHYGKFDSRFGVTQRDGEMECSGYPRYSYDSWIETPGAMDFLKMKVEGDPIYRPLVRSEV